MRRCIILQEVSRMNVGAVCCSSGQIISSCCSTIATNVSLCKTLNRCELQRCRCLCDPDPRPLESTRRKGNCVWAMNNVYCSSAPTTNLYCSACHSDWTVLTGQPCTTCESGASWESNTDSQQTRGLLDLNVWDFSSLLFTLCLIISASHWSCNSFFLSFFKSSFFNISLGFSENSLMNQTHDLKWY